MADPPRVRRLPPNSVTGNQFEEAKTSPQTKVNWSKTYKKSNSLNTNGISCDVGVPSQPSIEYRPLYWILSPAALTDTCLSFQPQEERVKNTFGTEREVEKISPLYIHLVDIKGSFPPCKFCVPLKQIFKASALWAGAFYKSICPYVCVSVCLCVCLSVHFWGTV